MIDVSVEPFLEIGTRHPVIHPLSHGGQKLPTDEIYRPFWLVYDGPGAR